MKFKQKKNKNYLRKQIKNNIYIYIYIYSIGYRINITVYLLLHLESFHYRLSGFYK